MQKRGRKKFNVFRLLVTMIIVSILVVVASREYTIYKVKQDIAATEQKIILLETEQKALLEERTRLFDDKYIEKLAREEHNMVKTGEVPLFIIEDKNSASQVKP